MNREDIAKIQRACKKNLFYGDLKTPLEPKDLDYEVAGRILSLYQKEIEKVLEPIKECLKIIIIAEEQKRCPHDAHRFMLKSACKASLERANNKGMEEWATYSSERAIGESKLSEDIKDE